MTLKAYFLTISFFFVALGPSLFSAELNLRVPNIRYFYTEKTDSEIENNRREINKKVNQSLHCGSCDRKFSCKTNLRSHLASIHYGKHYVCLHCNVFVSSFSGLQKHWNLCTGGSGRMPKSAYEDIWLKEPAQWAELDSIVENSLTLTGKFVCLLDGCNAKAFSHKSFLKSHIAYKHMGRRYMCLLCKLKFEKVNFFYNHVESCPQFLEKVSAGDCCIRYCSEVWNDPQYGGWHEADPCDEKGYGIEEARYEESEWDATTSSNSIRDFEPPSSGIVRGNKRSACFFYARKNNVTFFDVLNETEVKDFEAEVNGCMAAKAENNKCPLCERVFPDRREDFKRHVQVDHYGMRYLCGNCNIYITELGSSASRHAKRCGGKREFQKIHIRIYPTDEDLNVLVDYAARFSVNSGLFICPVASCNEVVVIQSDNKNSNEAALKKLREHIACKHMGRKYECSNCNKKFKTLALFNHHVKFEHENLVRWGLNGNSFVIESWEYEKDFPGKLKSPDEYQSIGALGAFSV